MSSSKGLEAITEEGAGILSPAPATPSRAADSCPRSRPRLPLLWSGIALLAAVGCLGLYRDLALLWICWTGDPLRSIGMLIPPASVVLTLRVWRQNGWQMLGTWWGLLVIGLSFFLSLLQGNALLLAVFGASAVSLFPVSLPIYVYASGVVLLFAGTRVWRKAWFPLGLLLLCQPVPGAVGGLIDLPLQSISAQVARSFATMIGFAPTTPQLRLMFSSDFGMFIAPGCDGIRGAVTMGYVALVLGYVKRVSLRRWAAYVIGAALLGYLFNFTRLCVLVIYYRIALGHPTLEGLAKQADYVIGACLFLVATLLFLWIVRRKEEEPAAEADAPAPAKASPGMRNLWLRCAAFAVVVLLALSSPSSVVRASPKSSATPSSLAAAMPRQIGLFNLNRTWYEQTAGGTHVIEAGAYSAPGTDEITLGVWVAPFSAHDATECWLARGLKPDFLVTRQFITAQGKAVPLQTGYYSDGITDSIVANAICTPSSCSVFQPLTSEGKTRFLILKPRLNEIPGSKGHSVSIMVRIDKIHSNAPRAVTDELLTSEAQKFLSGLDLNSLSRTFQ